MLVFLSLSFKISTIEIYKIFDELTFFPHVGNLSLKRDIYLITQFKILNLLILIVDKMRSKG